MFINAENTVGTLLGTSEARILNLTLWHSIRIHTCYYFVALERSKVVGLEELL